VEDIRSEAKRLESTPDLGHQESEENRAEEYQPNMSIPRGWQPIGEDQEAPNRVSNNALRREEISSQLDQGSNLVHEISQRYT
jgi:hypothetical protein